jgi:RNA polymerase sigma-70 factor (ECF subfamily)
MKEDHDVRKELEATYRAHRQALFSLALSITRNTALAEDAVHEAFVRILSNGACKADGPQESPSRSGPRDLAAYTFAAVRNAALCQLRRLKRTAGEPPAAGRLYLDDPAKLAQQGEQRRRLAEAVEELPDAQREAVVLRIYAELTFEQMAEVLGEPLPTVASRYRRAIGSLGQLLERPT